MNRATDWNIQSFINNKDQLRKTYHKWNMQSQKQLILQGFCICTELDKDVAWMKNIFTTILDTYSKVMQVTFYFKRW